MRAIIMEDLLCKLTNDLIWHHIALFLCNQSYKLCHMRCQVILSIEEINNLSWVLALHVFNFSTEPLHGLLQNSEQHVLDFSNFGIVWILKHIESRLNEHSNKVFFYFLFIPEILNVLLKDIQEMSQRLGRDHFDFIKNLWSLLLLFLMVGHAVFLCCWSMNWASRFSLAGFRQCIVILSFFEFAVVGEEPRDKVHISLKTVSVKVQVRLASCTSSCLWYSTLKRFTMLKSSVST